MQVRSGFESIGPNERFPWPGFDLLDFHCGRGCLQALCADEPEKLPPISERARQVHAAGMLFDGHNDLPWRLRSEGDFGLTKFDLSQRLNSGHTDIPRLREGGVKRSSGRYTFPASTRIPRTVTEQIDLVHRMVERYPNDFELAYSAADVERIRAPGRSRRSWGSKGAWPLKTASPNSGHFIRWARGT